MQSWKSPMKENIFSAEQQIKFENLVTAIELSDNGKFRGNRKAVIRYLVENGIEPATMPR
jgi:hypothetical protein